MSTQKKPTKKTAKPAKKKQAKKSNNRAKTTTKGSQMENTTNPDTSQQMQITASMMALLTSIDAKLAELVQIETYLAQRALETPKPQPQQPAAIATQPQPAEVKAPSRPGKGTIGGVVWDVCDYLMQQLGRAPSKEELLGAIKQHTPVINGHPVNELTIATQYSKWRASQGLPRLPRGFGAKPAQQPAQQPAAAPAVAAPSQPIPAAAVPSVIQPTAQPAAPAPLPTVATSLPQPTPQPTPPPWLRNS